MQTLCRKLLILSLKNFANCCRYLCLSFTSKDKLPAGETEPRGTGALLTQDGLLMQSSVARSGSAVYSEAASKSPIPLKSLETMMKHN